MDTKYAKLFSKALDAGIKRNYKLAQDILTCIVAETDSIPAAWLYLGRSHYASGDAEKAITAFIIYLKLKNDDPSGWFFLGRAYLYLNRATEASVCFKSAINNGRATAEAWAMLGFSELKLKRSAKAVDSLEKAVHLAPDDKRVYRGYLNALYVNAIRLLVRGNAGEAAPIFTFVIDNGLDGTAQRLYRSKAFRTLGRLKEALADLDVAKSISPDDVELNIQSAALRCALGDVHGAMLDMERSGVSNADHESAAWTVASINRYQIALALKNGDYRAALKAASDRIRNGETDAAIRAVAAQANYELGRFERAAAHYKRAIEVDPESPELRLGLALSLFELGDYKAALSAVKAAEMRAADKLECKYIQTLCSVKTLSNLEPVLPTVQQLLRIKPADERLMHALGECLYKTGNPSLADPWFVNVLQLNEKNELALLYRISIAESLGQANTEIIDRYSSYMAFYPDNNVIRKDYVEALVKSRKWALAATTIEEGTTYGSTKKFEAMLALCYKNAGRYHESAALYRDLLRANPKNSDYLLSLAYSLSKTGAQQLVKELLERGAAYIESADAYLALGSVLVGTDEPEKAAAAFMKASDLAPDDPRPLRNLSRLYTKAGLVDMAKTFEKRAKAASKK